MSISPKTESRTFFRISIPLPPYFTRSNELTEETLSASIDEFINSIGTPDLEVGHAQFSIESISSAKGMISEFLVQKEDVQLKKGIFLSSPKKLGSINFY